MSICRTPIYIWESDVALHLWRRKVTDDGYGDWPDHEPETFPHNVNIPHDEALVVACAYLQDYWPDALSETGRKAAACANGGNLKEHAADAAKLKVRFTES